MSRIRIDLRLAAASVLALAAGIGVLAITRPPQTVEALVAAADLPPGMPLAGLDLETRDLAPLPGLVPSRRLDRLSEHSLLIPLGKGEPLFESMLGAEGDRPHGVALTLSPGNSVQGQVVPGDAVDIYATSGGETSLLASRIVVLWVESGRGGLSGFDVALVLAVDEDLAPALIQAAHTGSIDLARVPR
jgi:Flp pilus assembly protein CpaB